MGMPLPPSKLKENDGTLTVNETEYILDSTLKSKQRKDATTLSFIDAFIRCKSIQQASSESGIHPSLGYRLRHNNNIANAIQKLVDKSSVKHGIDGSEIFERVKEVVDFDPIELMNPDGTFKSNLHDVAPEARRCLRKMKVKNLYSQETDLNGMKSKIIIGELIEYEFYDKLKGAELIGKEKQMFKNTTVVEHTVTKNMADILLASKKRADALTAPDIIEAEVVRE